MDLTEAMKKAAKIVEDAKLPSDLRATAFKTALDSLMGVKETEKTTTFLSPHGHDHPIDGTSKPMELIGRKLGIPNEILSEVFEVKDGSLDVILAYSRLEKGKANGARQLAILVGAGRQAAGIDDDGWTPVSEIRKICKEFDKFDSANFAGTISDMDRWFSVSGRGQSRKVKMTRAGWEHAKQLVEELTA